MRKSGAAPVIEPLRLGDLEAADDTVLREGASLEGIRISDARVEWRSLADLFASECRFENLQLHESSLVRARFSETQLSRLDVAGLDAARSSWRFCELDGCRIGSAELFDSSWESVRVRDSKLGYLNLRGAELANVEFIGCRIEELDLQGARVRRLAFRDCEIETLSVRQATLSDVDLRGAVLSEIQGVDSLRGTIVTDQQLLGLAPLLARHLGITVT